MITYGIRTRTIASDFIEGKSQCIYRIEGAHRGSFEQVVRRFFSKKRPVSGMRCRIYVGRLPAREEEWEMIEGWLTLIQRPGPSSKFYRIAGILQCVDKRRPTVLVRFNGTYPACEEVRIGLLRPEKDEL